MFTIDTTILDSQSKEREMNFHFPTVVYSSLFRLLSSQLSSLSPRFFFGFGLLTLPLSLVRGEFWQSSLCYWLENKSRASKVVKIICGLIVAAQHVSLWPLIEEDDQVALVGTISNPGSTAGPILGATAQRDRQLTLIIAPVLIKWCYSRPVTSFPSTKCHFRWASTIKSNRFPTTQRFFWGLRFCVRFIFIEFATNANF